MAKTKTKPRGLNELDIATGQFLIAMSNYITDYFGPPCTTTNEDCAICNLWALYDAARELTDVDG